MGEPQFILSQVKVCSQSIVPDISQSSFERFGEKIKLNEPGKAEMSRARDPGDGQSMLCKAIVPRQA